MGHATRSNRGISTNHATGHGEGVMKRATAAFLAFATATLVPAMTLAAPDQYLGDASIYNSTGGVQPNVLVIIDNSGSMDDKVLGESYNPTKTYPQTKSCNANRENCKPNAVYTKAKSTTNKLHIDDVAKVTNSCGKAKPRDLLQGDGTYRGTSLSPDGTCSGKGNSAYFTGNYLNYLAAGGGTMVPKIDIAKDVVKHVLKTSSGIRFGLMVYNYPATTGEGGRFLSSNVTGTSTKYVSTIKDMDAFLDEKGSITNRAGLIAAVDSLKPLGNTPMGETLFEAMRYFSGGASAFGNTIGITGGKYTSPVEYPCQKNIIIFVSDGMSNADDNDVLKTLSAIDKETKQELCTNGDCDGDGKEPKNLNHVLDDVAKALRLGPQEVTTYTIGFDVAGSNLAAVALLKQTADSNHGNGAYIEANSQDQLASAFNAILDDLDPRDTSISAPVVPVSPENRTYGSGRVFMGFLKPFNDGFWRGNLKKYGISSSSDPIIVDADRHPATYVDEDNDNKDDKTGEDLVNAVNGTFRKEARSYWTDSADGPDGSTIDRGGAGQLLQKKEAASRKIYTYTGTSKDLTNDSNAFSTANSAITNAMLGVTISDTRNELIAFVRGQDVYDENKNKSTTDNRPWILGDILHSKPVVVNYASYEFTTANEKLCDKNKSVIYVGSNDGMLHAFQDCTGEELWGFIPPSLLPNLQYLADDTHTYFADSTPVAYVHDANRDGTINTATSSPNDKAILIFGTRRGGGVASGKAVGSYFALDVTDPAKPQYLWSISNSYPLDIDAKPTFAELAESWSEPKIVRMKIGTSEKLVAVIGAGYDNVNEDGRFGATQGFTGTSTVLLGEAGEGNSTNTTGSSAPASPKGRGIYLIEVATLESGGQKLNFSKSGSKIGEFTASKFPAMTFSFPSEIAAIDANNTGYTSRLYAADTGGNIWRFDVGDPDTTKWKALWLFRANPAYVNSTANWSNVGRKIFYKPSVVSEHSYKMLFFGTGDREHPLNTAVVDRIYALIDRGQVTTVTESDLLDVTEDQLQTTTITSGAGSVSDLLKKLNASSNHGWFIKLNENSGEKVLSAPLVYNKVAYFTTYTPATSTPSTDPCDPQSRLGTARIYALNYKTGEAAINYDTKNDNTKTDNKRAITPNGILQRSDRAQKIGTGIPSGVSVMLSADGGGKALTGSDGALGTGKTTPGGGVIPLYWMQK